MKKHNRTLGIETLETRALLSASPMGEVGARAPEPQTVLVGMLLPAVQKVREAAARSTADHKETIEVPSWSLSGSTVWTGTVRASDQGGTAAPDGRKYKMLVAPLILDQDGTQADGGAGPHVKAFGASDQALLGGHVKVFDGVITAGEANRPAADLNVMISLEKA